MIKLKFISILALSYYTMSCNSNPTGNNKELNIDYISNSKSKDTDSKGDNICLLSFQNKYNELIEDKEIITLTGFDVGNMKVKYRNTNNNPIHHEYVWHFTNGRKGKVKGSKHEITLPDIIAIKHIKPNSLSNFRQQHKVLTKEEIVQAKEVLNEASKGNLENEEAKKAMEIAKSKNISSQSINHAGGELLDMFQEVSNADVEVKGLGDAAYWNSITNELNVLQHGVEFTIKAEISNSENLNKDKAIELAKKVISKCP